MNPTHERIPRTAECIQWDGKNTDAVMSMLSRNNIVGDLYREGKYILIKIGGCTETAIGHGDWVFEREDGKVCFHSDLDHKSKYRPIFKTEKAVA